MKIELTKEQYQTLIKLLHLGTWMANAHRTDDIIEEFEDLEQYILSYGKDFGMEEHIEYDEGLKQFFLKEEYIEDSGLEELIDEYNEETLWDELLFRLADRDMIEKYGIEALQNMDPDEVWDKRFPFLEFYEKEFEENGLENLRVIKGSELIQ